MSGPLLPWRVLFTDGAEVDVDAADEFGAVVAAAKVRAANGARSSVQFVVEGARLRTWAMPRDKPAGHRIEQAAILALSAIAATLLCSPAPFTRWGYVVGLCSQPFWIVSTWRARQWGMFALALWYCGAWAVGIFNHWH